MSHTLNNYYNKLKIEKYLTVINYRTPEDTSSKFRMIDGTAMFGVKGQRCIDLLTTLDYETNTLTAYSGVKNTFAKRLQTQIMIEAEKKGINIENETGRRYRSGLEVGF